MFNKVLPTLQNAIVRSASGVTLQQITIPMVGPGELLLMPLFAGLCGTDIQILRGVRNDPAVIIGHEGVAQIIRVGSNCPDYLAPGVNVLVNPTHPDRSEFLFGHNVNGMFQEYIHIPEIAVSAGLIVRLTDTLPLELAPLIEPLAAVIYSFELLQPQQRDGAIIIYGDGIIGHLALLLARSRFGNIKPIILVHHRQEGLNWSRENNIHASLDLLFSQLFSSQLLIKKLQPSTAIIATPRTGTIDCLNHAVKCIAFNGHIDILGGLPDKAYLPSLPGIDLIRLRNANCSGFPAGGVFEKTIYKENKPLVLCGHRGVSNTHLLQAITELATNKTIYAKLISHIVSLNEAANFMQHICQQGRRQINGQRVMKMAIRIHSTNAKQNNYFNQPKK